MGIDQELQILEPGLDWRVEDPEVSIVVPALNEEITIGEFVDWCWEGIRESGVRAEILIIDSSADKTAEIALSKGARVLKSPKKGLGQAYIDSLDFIRGKYVILGDCDLTYDFRNLTPFIQEFRKGSEFVMGSRFRGSIEKGSMPGLHRYFGTPLTNWILNVIYRTRFTDIHCGMRGLSLEAFKKLKLSSTGWEYASEMVLKSARLGFKTSEVPVAFYKDRDGRLSHHKRAGFLSPWIAGWINLKVMLVFSPETFLIIPAFLFAIGGAGITLASAYDSIFQGNLGMGATTFLGGIALALVGLFFILTAALGKLMHNFQVGWERRLVTIWTYNRGIGLAVISIIAGLLCLAIFIASNNDFQKAIVLQKVAVAGVSLLILGGVIFSATLITELYRRLKDKF